MPRRHASTAVVMLRGVLKQPRRWHDDMLRTPMFCFDGRNDAKTASFDGQGDASTATALLRRRASNSHGDAATSCFDNRGDARTEAWLLRRCCNGVFHGRGECVTTGMAASMMVRWRASTAAAMRRWRPGCFDDGAMTCFNGCSNAPMATRLLCDAAMACFEGGDSGVKDAISKATLTP